MQGLHLAAPPHKAALGKSTWVGKKPEEEEEQRGERTADLTIPFP